MRLENDFDGKVCYIPVRRDGVCFLLVTLMPTPLGMSLVGGTFPEEGRRRDFPAGCRTRRAMCSLERRTVRKRSFVLSIPMTFPHVTL